MATLIIALILLSSLIQGSVSLIKGVQVRPRNKWPWFASISLGDGGVCGGTILDDRHILTSVKCIGLAATMKVTVGLYRPGVSSNTVQQLNVRRLFEHPDFNASSQANDLAIIRTSRMTFSVAVQPAVISDSSFDGAPGMDCWLAGYGLVEQDPEVYPKVFQELGTMVLDKQRCKKMAEKKFGLGDLMTKFTLCTRNVYSGPCTGDLGGPVGCFFQDEDFRVMGVLSWGNIVLGRRCDLGFNVYTRISQYTDWISSIIT